MSTRKLRVQLLLTGSEIMSGDTIDSNSAYIAQRLDELAISIFRKVTAGDDLGLLKKELSEMAADADLVIVNGGLGPTIDDLTAQVLAEVAGVELNEHSTALQHLQAWCAERNLSMNAANRKQALLPAGAGIVDNPIGSAVGFEMTIGQCQIVCTPGVPGELAQMMDIILDKIRQRFPTTYNRHILRLQTFGLGESTAQQMISDAIDNWPAEVDLGFRAGAPQMEVKLTVDSDDALATQQHCRDRLQDLFGDHIIGEGDTQLADRVLHLLRERGAKITTAESCTGGLIASMLTKVAGSSDCFEAGFVTYANNIKRSILDVNEATLAQHGAVSEAVVVEMLQGALRKSGADYGVAVSGIAGPGGGTTEKPVGTVWLAWGEAQSVRTRCLCWPVERVLFQTMIAAAALDMIRRLLLGYAEEPRYFDQRRIRT
ncbi:MAG: CinA family nicotinamide mononucleotide deamidase-related protein [Pseudomonadota bacterium]